MIACEQARWTVPVFFWLCQDLEKCSRVVAFQGRMQIVLCEKVFVFCCFRYVLSKTGDAEDNMKAFPPADQGMSRFVLQLPEQPSLIRKS